MLDDMKELKDFVLNNIVAYCDKCGTPYRRKDITVLYNTTNSLVVQLTCSKCGAKYVVQLIRPGNAAQKVPVITDVNPDSIADYIAAGPLNYDSVLAIYKLLNKPRITLKEFLKNLNKEVSKTRKPIQTVQDLLKL